MNKDSGEREEDGGGERERQARLQRAESMQRPARFFFFTRPFFLFFSPSQMIHRGKKKASSLSSVEPNISFLLERQEGNTHSHTHTQRKALTSGFFAAREIRSST